MNQTQIFESIVKHRSLVRGIAAKAVKKCGIRLPSDGLEDLTSDVCLNLATRRMKSYKSDGGRSVKGWIAMTANCATLNVLRAYKYTEHYSTTDASADEGEPTFHVVAADSSTVADRANALREVARLETACSDLEPADRDLVDAMATGTEHAYRLRHGLTPTQMSRAKARVRELLARLMGR